MLPDNRAAMPVAIGSQLGSLEIVSLLGQGGMGEVYRARDTKLKREVAIKILPDEFSQDTDRVSRFQREAEVLASLNHSNIASIYDLQESNGLRYLILELVDGDTLADRIRRGPIAVDEALTIAAAICEALEAAHEKGIIHRDLKPANVKVTPDGHIKVLDFGLAKPLEPVTVRGNTMSNSPTLLSGTIGGMILGTASYMSPEQARGRALDARTDVFAFGCVLYEMLTGRQAFDGEDISEVLASVMKSEVDFTRLPANVNPRLRELLRRCLEKNRKNRWHAIGDVRFEIESILRAGAEESGNFDGKRNPQRYWLATTAVLLVSTLVFAGLSFRSRSTSSEPFNLSIAPPDGVAFSDNQTGAAVISPDGNYIVFTTGDRNSSKLWFRSLHADDARPVDGSDGASAPFWSPDSKAVAFFSNGRLLRAELRGGKPQLISGVDTANAGRASGTWNREGTILFGLDTGRPIYRIAATGGKITEATILSSEDRGHYRPFFLPDGNRFLFVNQSMGANAGVYVGALDSKETKRILDGAGSAAAYAPSGQLLFLRNGTLFAQDFDLKTLSVREKPIQIADSVFGVGSSGAFSAFSVSESGVLAYRTANSMEVRGETQLTWFSREGKVLSTIGRPGSNRNPRLSPNGMRVAIEILGTSGRGSAVWLLGPGEISTGLTENAAEPVWSSDGGRVIYSLRMPRTQPQVAERAVAGKTGEEQVLYSGSDSPEDVNDVSPDGKYVVGTTVSGQTNRDLIAVPLDGSGKPQAIAATAAQELYGRLSPDGHWIAFSSDSTGVPEVYVQAFPQGGNKTLVSRNGGAWPVWRPDGKEPFYIASDSKMMAVGVSLTNGFQPGTTQALFEVPLGLGQGLGSPAQYDVTADGQRFLVNARAGDFKVSPIHIVLNWPELLKR